MGKKISQTSRLKSYKSKPLLQKNQLQKDINTNNNCEFIQGKSQLNSQYQFDKQNNHKLKINEAKIKKQFLQNIQPNLMFRKRQWTQNEDLLLIQAIQKYGPQKWGFIAQFVPGRMGKQCRQRWHNHLNPKINKNQWTQQQQWILFLLFTIHGGKWAYMTKFLTQRTDNSIKNHWNSIMQKKISSLEERLSNILQNLIIKFNQDPEAYSKEADQKKQIQSDIIKQILQKLFFQKQDKQKQSFVPEQGLSKQEKQITGFDKSKDLHQNYIPVTSQELNFKQKGFSFVNKEENKKQNLFNFQYILNNNNSIPFLIQKTSNNSLEPEQLNLQKQKQDCYGIFQSQKKLVKNLSFVDKNQICSSPPKIKAQYSKLFNEQSQDFQFQILNQPQLIQKKSSRNYILTSPAAFLQKKNSSII